MLSLPPVLNRLIILWATCLLPGCGAVGAGLIIDTARLAFSRAPVEACPDCVEDKAAADHLADSMPGWVEQSRLAAGPGAVATRTGNFSWEVSAPGIQVSHCHATVRRAWRCDPEPGTSFSPL